MNAPKATLKKLVAVETFFVNIEEVNKQGKAEEVSYLAFFNPKSSEHKLTLAKVTKLELSVAKQHITDQFLLEKLTSNAQPHSSTPFVPPPPTVKPTLPRKGNTGSVSKLKEVLRNTQQAPSTESEPPQEPAFKEPAPQEKPTQTNTAQERSIQEKPKRGRPPKKPQVADLLDDATP